MAKEEKEFLQQKITFNKEKLSDEDKFDCTIWMFLEMVKLIDATHQQQLLDPPPELPAGKFGLAGLCCGPILIPLAF